MKRDVIEHDVITEAFRETNVRCRKHCKREKKQKKKEEKSVTLSLKRFEKQMCVVVSTAKTGGKKKRKCLLVLNKY